MAKKQENMNKGKPSGPSGPGKGVPPKFSRGIMGWLVGIMLAAVLIAVVAQPWDRKPWTQQEFWEAKEAGAKIVATGRSDFPNQVNNSIGFPAIFRGALDVRAKTITDEMCIEAAHELAKCAEDRGISEENIAPTMGEWEVFIREAVAVGMKAQEQGVARIKASREELTQKAEKMIKGARDTTELLMREGLIPPAPAD